MKYYRDRPRLAGTILLTWVCLSFLDNISTSNKAIIHNQLAILLLDFRLIRIPLY